MSEFQRVLIIEDEPDIRAAIREALEMEGYVVISAGHGQAGLAILGEMETPAFILLDLMMPVMNGWEFLNQKREDAKIADIPVIVMSAGAAIPLAPGTLFLRKPFDLDRLLSLAGELAKQRQAASLHKDRSGYENSGNSNYN